MTSPPRPQSLNDSSLVGTYGVFVPRSVGSQCVVARFAPRYLTGICAVVSVLGHSTCWLALLVDTYGVFVRRSVFGHSA